MFLKYKSFLAVKYNLPSASLAIPSWKRQALNSVRWIKKSEICLPGSGKWVDQPQREILFEGRSWENFGRWRVNSWSKCDRYGGIRQYFATSKLRVPSVRRELVPDSSSCAGAHFDSFAIDGVKLAVAVRQNTDSMFPILWRHSDHRAAPKPFHRLLSDPSLDLSLTFLVQKVPCLTSGVGRSSRCLSFPPFLRECSVTFHARKTSELLAGEQQSSSTPFFWKVFIQK